MKTSTASVVASMAAAAAAATTSRTFAVLRFQGDGFMTEGRVDPVVSPGVASGHMHGIMGGSNFNLTIEGDQLLTSNCTNAMILNDHSNYWAPEVYFNDPNNGSFTKVPLFYMNVYYFFEPTDDEIVPFPPGMKMITGDASTRTPPAFGGGSNLDPAAGPIQPVQFTCPRSSYTPASYPANSDGTTAGMQDPNNQGAGAGFPLYPCDGYASPLRSDLHFPSCYNPTVGPDDYKNNMAWPNITNGKQNCPSGYIHVPHLFFELYWNTPLFNDLWTPDGKNQPFVLANGDRTGYSLHGDFVSGWDANTLQTIISTCDAGDSGMDKCPSIPGGLNTVDDCKIQSPIPEPQGLTALLSALPGNNPLSGWGVSAPANAGSSASSAASQATSATSATSVAAASQAGSSSASKASVTASSSSSKSSSAASSQNATTTSKAAASTAPAVAGNVAVTSTGGASDSSGPTLHETSTVTKTTTAHASGTSPARCHGHAARHAGPHARR